MTPLDDILSTGDRIDAKIHRRLIMMFEDGFLSGGFIDCIDFLKPLENTSSAIGYV